MNELHCLIVAGGHLSIPFAEKLLEQLEYSYVIAADAGLLACIKLSVPPNLAVGDFDTLGRERMEALCKENGWSFDVHNPEKDETDMELAVRAALKAGYKRAFVLGATGGRLDHELSNIQLMLKAARKGLSMELFDEKNKIFLLDSTLEHRLTLKKKEAFGKYVSFLPLTERVCGITLEGFRYPLLDKDISILENPSLCVSNELVEEEASIFVREGVLICIESRD